MATAKNNVVIQSIAAPAGAVGSDCTDVSLWDAATGGNFLATQSISTNPAALVLGEKYEFAVNALVLNQPQATDEQAEMAIRALKGKVGTSFYIQFHTGAPGSNGTANVISDLGRKQVTASQMTFAA